MRLADEVSAGGRQVFWRCGVENMLNAVRKLLGRISGNKVGELVQV
mgnify:CR=1 FL=1